MNLRLKNISLPLAGLTLEIDVELHSQVTAIFGPSGGGKTSLLDTLAGLRRPRSAFIELNGRVLTDTAAGVEVPTRLREIGYVPQDLALFPTCPSGAICSSATSPRPSRIRSSTSIMW